MKKWIIIILMVLMMVQVVYGIEECQRKQNPSDIPCLLVTSWTPPNACNTYQALIFNTTGDLIGTQTMGIIGVSGRCNATFNYTSLGQYYINSTMGDTWNVLVEGDDMIYIATGIILMGITFLLGLFALKIENAVGKIALICSTIIFGVFDLFMAAKIVEVTQGSGGIADNLYTLYHIGIWVQWGAIWFMVVTVLVFAFKFLMGSVNRDRQEREDLYR